MIRKWLAERLRRFGKRVFPEKSATEEAPDTELTIVGIGLKILALNVFFASLYTTSNLTRSIASGTREYEVILYYTLASLGLVITTIVVWRLSNHWSRYGPLHKIGLIVIVLLIITYALSGTIIESGKVTERMQSLRESLKSGKTERTRRLIQEGTKLTYGGTEFPSLLHLATRMGKLQVVGLMLRQNVDYTRKSPYYNNRTPLHLAVQKNHRPVARLLLMYGADPTVPDGPGNSALDYAVQSGRLDMLDLLLHRAEDLDLNHVQLKELVQRASGETREKIVDLLRNFSEHDNGHPR